MATPETLPDSADTKDSLLQPDLSTIVKALTWFILILLTGLYVLWSKLDKSEQKTDQCLNGRIIDNKELTLAWAELAKEKDATRIATAYLVRYTNDTAIQRRIDSAVRSEQSGR